ncbi:hypothetical protein EB796_018211 [Bugula neritina]|uniref:Uncharacterized protein n=1 Tax=Bugula neritina TaxID=10212 RepID=A0A7J7JB47_BUGNE|nr:hypothetical protein EB796_018211 [Bugula neritina]
MVELHGKLLIADFSNYKLKVLDQSKQEVGPVCFRGESPCTESSEFTEHPASLLNIDDVIYVGLRKNIYKLSGNNLPCPYHNISAELPLYSQTVQVKWPRGHW